jgi:HAD superfamily hydrolase (TIGR01509 family)
MAQIKAILFDQDGVIIDTERDGHRVSFNMTFKEFGYNFEWGVDEYHELLQIAGGKERMKHYLHTKGFGVPVKPEEEEDLIKRLHKRKTALFVELIASGALPLRPGIKRFMQEAMAAGLKIGVCTTSNEEAAKTLTTKILKDIKFDVVLAGDIVKKKKPDPEIYNLALEKTGLAPTECLVIEDSRNGVLAAKAAGMFVVATTNLYTEKEDLHEADIVVTCLGDPDGEKGKLKQGGEGLAYDGVLRVNQMVKYFAAR